MGNSLVNEQAEGEGFPPCILKDCPKSYSHCSNALPDDPSESQVQECMDENSIMDDDKAACDKCVTETVQKMGGGGGGGSDAAGMSIFASVMIAFGALLL